MYIQTLGFTGPYTKFEYVNKKHMTSATCTEYVQ